MGSNTELAWCAGFFDGEGTTGVLRAKRDKHKYLRMGVSQKFPETLERFQNALGGRIYKSKTREIYSWNLYSNEAVYYAIQYLWPYLSVHKREQANKAIEEVLGKESKL